MFPVHAREEIYTVLDEESDVQVEIQQFRVQRSTYRKLESLNFSFQFDVVDCEQKRWQMPPFII